MQWNQVCGFPDAPSNIVGPILCGAGSEGLGRSTRPSHPSTANCQHEYKTNLFCGTASCSFSSLISNPVGHVVYASYAAKVAARSWETRFAKLPHAAVVKVQKLKRGIIERAHEADGFRIARQALMVLHQFQDDIGCLFADLTR